THGVVTRLDAVQLQRLQLVIQVTDTDIANGVAVAGNRLHDGTVGRQQLRGGADTVTLEHGIDPDAIGAGGGGRGEGGDALVFAARVLPVGAAAVMDAAQLLGGQLLARVVGVDHRHVPVGGHGEGHDVNAILMALLDF